MWLSVTYVTVISHDMVDLRLYDSCLHKVHALTAKSMLVSVDMNTLVYALIHVFIILR